MIGKILAVLAALWLVFIMAVGSDCPQSDLSEGEVSEYPEKVTSGLKKHVWYSTVDSSTPVAEAVEALEFNRSHWVSRLLIRDRSGAAIVMTNQVIPLKGLHIFDIFLDRLGWGLEVTLDYGKQWPGVRSYYLMSGDEFGHGCGRDLKQIIRTSSGSEFVVNAPSGDNSPIDTPRLLSNEELVLAIRQNVAEPERKLIQQLSKNVHNPTAVGVPFNGPIHLLSRAFESEGASETWIVRSKDRRDEVTLHVADFVSSFQSLEGSDPLAGLHLEDPAGSE